MSAALYPVLESPDIAVEAEVDGKALARASDQLDRLALGAGVTPLTHFISVEGDDYGILHEKSPSRSSSAASWKKSTLTPRRRRGFRRRTA